MRTRRWIWIFCGVLLFLLLLWQATAAFIVWKYSTRRLVGLTEQQIEERLGKPDFREQHEMDGDFVTGYGDFAGQKYEVEFSKNRVVNVRSMR
jgi:hypothetical protein